MVLESFITWSYQLIVNFSYVAVFAISVLSSSTIFLPFPVYLVIFFASGLGLNPAIVGILAGLGSAIGEISGYLVGLGGMYIAKEEGVEKAVKKKRLFSKFVKKFESLFERFGFWIIILTAFLPFPFDVIGMLSGATKYDMKKFLIATSIGKIAKCLLIAYAGYFAIPYVKMLFVAA
jgi:membrane-associated protein